MSDTNQLPVDIPQLQDAIHSPMQNAPDSLVIDLALVLDPHVRAVIDRVIENRIRDATNAQDMVWRSQEQTLLAQQAAMQRQLDVLTTQLAHSSLTRTLENDMQMHTRSSQAPRTMPADEQRDASHPQRRATRATSRTWSATSSADSNTSGVTTRGMLARQTAATSQTAATQALPLLNPRVSQTAVNLPLLNPRVTIRQGSERNEHLRNQANPSNSTNAPAKKTAGNLHRFHLRDMPTDMGGLNAALQIHVRILWGLLDPSIVPGDPPATILSTFQAHFTTESQLLSAFNNGRDLLSREHIRVGTARTASGATSRIYRQARAVEDNMVSYMEGCLSKFGLPIWCPDLRQSPYSLYNSACRIIAIDTFKQALVSHTYAYLNPNTIYASHSELLMKLFDHFVFYYMKKRYTQECRRPGSVAKDLTNNPQYTSRKRLAEARMKFLSENKYPSRYSKLINVKATSDDEYDPVRDVYVVRRRRERSEQAETFFRMLDAKREKAAKQESAKKWRERKRWRPANTDAWTYSEFEELPKGLPIDYFDPTFYNNLQPKLRREVAVPHISMLPNMERSFTWCAEEHLRDETFDRRFASDILRRYDIVTDADLADNGEEDDDSDEEWAGEGSSMSEDEQEALDDEDLEAERRGLEEERQEQEMDASLSEEDTAVEDEDI